MKPDELVNEIFEIINTLRAQEMGSLSGDTLSRLVLKLASYKASLGETVADAYKVSLDAEAEYYAARAEEFRRLRDDGKGSTDAGELKHLGSKDSFLAWNQARYQYQRFNQLSKDCHDLIDSVRGRLITLQSERSEANAR